MRNSGRNIYERNKETIDSYVSGICYRIDKGTSNGNISKTRLRKALKKMLRLNNEGTSNLVGLLCKEFGLFTLIEGIEVYNFNHDVAKEYLSRE